MKRLLPVAVASWMAGFGAYVAALAIFWGQSLSRGDLGAVLMMSAVASAVAVALVYAPVMFAIRRRFASAPSWIFPVASTLLGIVPVALIVRYWGGDLRALASPEAALFFCMFAAFGIVFGIGFYLTHVKEPRG